MAKIEAAHLSGAVSVAITDTPVVPLNTGRQEITIVNDSANVVYLKLQTIVGQLPVAAANQGVRLNANGGSYTTGVFLGAINAIAVGGVSVITVTEI